MRVSVMDSVPSSNVGAPAAGRVTCSVNGMPLHGEEPEVVVVHHVVERDHVRMTNVCERPELLLQIIDARRVDAAQRLERDIFSALAIKHLIDDAHATGALAKERLVARRAEKLRHDSRL